MFKEVSASFDEKSLSDPLTPDCLSCDGALPEDATTPENVERWRRAAARLVAEAETTVCRASCCQPGYCDIELREPGYFERRSAFARVMKEALGSLLLRGGGEELQTLERWGLEK